MTNRKEAREFELKDRRAQGDAWKLGQRATPELISSSLVSPMNWISGWNLPVNEPTIDTLQGDCFRELKGGATRD